jgi:hypothetical protein
MVDIVVVAVAMYGVAVVVITVASFACHLLRQQETPVEDDHQGSPTQGPVAPPADDEFVDKVSFNMPKTGRKYPIVKTKFD